MPIDVRIMRADGSRYDEIDRTFDQSQFLTLDVVAQGYTFFPPKVGSVFIMRGMLVFATKDVNDATDTVITIYEAPDENSTIEAKILFRFGMGKLTALPLVPLLIQVTEGSYLNAKTDDDDINMTVFGFYAHVIR